MQQREKLGSRLGFILLSAGCAIGIGNVWKFPYITGQNGGGWFVLIYLLFLVIMGVPVMTMEFSVGRASRKSPVAMYRPIEPAGSKWHLHGYAAFAGLIILMMFYTNVSGWMLKYFVSTAAGDFAGLSTEAVAARFPEMLSDPVSMTIYMGVIVALGFLVCSFGLQKGLERISKYMMLLLLCIMIVLAVHSAVLPGGAEGLRFYLMPDAAKVREIGLFNVIVSAMNQAFFTLSLGIGAMAIFGSYIGRDHALMGESINIAALDTFVALTSGLIIFPACSAFGVQPDSGPGLVFITLPNIFNNMPLGRLWGSLFFLFMTFAAFSTVLAVFEAVLSCTQDLFGWSRKKACLYNGILMFLLSLPCVFGTNIWSSVAPFGEGSSIMDLEDFAVSNVLLPLGSLIVVLFCTAKRGWGWKNFKAEADEGRGVKVASWMRVYLTYVLPLLIFALFVIGIVQFFH